MVTIDIYAYYSYFNIASMSGIQARGVGITKRTHFNNIVYTIKQTVIISFANKLISHQETMLILSLFSMYNICKYISNDTADIVRKNFKRTQQILGLTHKMSVPFLKYLQLIMLQPHVPFLSSQVK